MDLIIDTNILRQDRFLRSTKFQAVFDYLDKTNSLLVIPTIVKQEIVALCQRETKELLIRIEKQLNDLKDWCLTEEKRPKIDINLEEEVSAYKEFIEGLFEDESIIVEAKYKDDYLEEAVRRTMERVPPASSKGEGFRDVIVWLSAKDYLRESESKKAIFISGDRGQFAREGSIDLHEDLVAELAREKLELKYYVSLDDFISEQGKKVEFITDNWIEKQLFHKLEELALSEMPQDDKWLRRYGEYGGLSWTGYREIAGFSYLNLHDYYVYELPDEEFYLHMIYVGEVLAELEFEDPYRTTIRRGSKLRLVTARAIFSFECKIRNGNIEGLRLESWDFL